MATLTERDRDKLRKSQFAYVDRKGGEHLPINDEVAHPERDGALEPDRVPERDREGAGAPEDRRRRAAPRHRGRQELERREADGLAADAPSRLLRDAFRGALAGAAATWLMDQVTTGLYEAQPPEVTKLEAAGRPNGKSSVANLVDRVEAATGLDPPGDAPAGSSSTPIHYALGDRARRVLRRRPPVPSVRSPRSRAGLRARPCSPSTTSS